MYNIIDSICLVLVQYICLVQMSVQYTWHYMFSSNECTIYLTIYLTVWVYNMSVYKWVYILDTICLVQMSVQWVYNILDNICLVQMSVQYTWQYMFSSNECTIYLTVKV